MASLAEQEANLRAQLAAVQQQQLPPLALRVPSATITISLLAQHTAYDPVARTIIISGEAKKIDAHAQELALAFMITHAGDGAGVTACIKLAAEKLAAARPELGSQAKLGLLSSLPGAKSPIAQQRSVSEVMNGTGSNPVLLALSTIFFVQELLVQAGADPAEILRMHGNDPASFAVAPSTQLMRGPPSHKSVIFCHELRECLEFEFELKPDGGCSTKQRNKIAHAAWVNIQAAAAGGGCGVETAAALALGEIQFKETCTARDKGIQKWWKNKLGARTAAHKKRTAAAMEAGRSAANPEML